jgi:hypothetical protein
MLEGGFPIAWPAMLFSRMAKATLTGTPFLWEAFVEGCPLGVYFLKVVLLIQKTLIYSAIS